MTNPNATPKIAAEPECTELTPGGEIDCAETDGMTPTEVDRLAEVALAKGGEVQGRMN